MMDLPEDEKNANGSRLSRYKTLELGEMLPNHPLLEHNRLLSYASIPSGSDEVGRSYSVGVP